MTKAQAGFVVCIFVLCHFARHAHASGGLCRSEVEKQVSATAAFADCSAATGLRLDKKLKKKDDDDPTRSAFCQSSACFQVYTQLRSLGALVCLQDFSTSSMSLWLEATGPSCFGSAMFGTPEAVEVEESATPSPPPPASISPPQTSPPSETIAAPVGTHSPTITPIATPSEEGSGSQTGSASQSEATPQIPATNSSNDGVSSEIPSSLSYNESSMDTDRSSGIGLQGDLAKNSVSRTSDSEPSSRESGRHTTPIVIWLILATSLLLVLLIVLACVVKRRRRRLNAGSAYVKGASTTRGRWSVSQTLELSNEPALHLAKMAEVDVSTDEMLHSYRIPMEKLVVGTLLSRGGYGEVYEGSYRDKVVAIKTLLPDQRRNMPQIQSFLQEVKLLVTLEHERIVQFIGVAWDSLSELSVVMEFMEGGDLRTLLREYEADASKPCGFDAEKVKIALHVAHGLVYLHSLDPFVVHRDLKSRNILLDTELNAKLTDFGVSRELSDGTMTAGVGSSLWMAPEVMLGERYDEKADIFSFGVVLSELDRHVLPYSHAIRDSNGNEPLPQTTIMQMVSTGRLTVAFTDVKHSLVAQLGKECVALDPGERPQASEVLYRLHQIHEKLSIPS